ncbi:hypothetical protein N0V94_006374 [Neodidymelliopsis sp. IMI 364377]|nr:hypothetical protein N0V94_006374 [Neodidymelliopsis sp. IMI 364377]
MALERAKVIYRSVLFQIIIVGLVAFCEPGIWTALNNLGAGGNASITAKWTLVIGAAFYTPYAAGLYCNNRYGNEWFMLLGAALCGIGASLLWASEAAIAVGYPEDEKRGRYVGIWMGIRQMGPLVGGAISLALNVKTKEKGKVTYTTYLGLVAISSLGAPFALLLSQPQKVNRSDGTKIPYMKKTNFKTEARAIFRQLKNPYMLLLIPVFLTGQFGVTYQGNYLTSKSHPVRGNNTAKLIQRVAYFTVRSRALASFLTAIVGALANLLTGIVLDLPQFSRPAKSKAVYIFVVITVTASWTWNAIVETKLSRMTTPPSFDLGDGAFFNSAFTVYMCFRFFYEVLQTYVYWLMAEIKGAKGDGDVARTTGILRSWESIGSTIAYAIGAVHISNETQMIIGFALWAVTVPFTLMAVFGNWNKGVPKDEHESTDESDLEVQSVDAGERKY